MEDLFNFSNPDAVLGNDSNLSPKAASLLNPPRGIGRSTSSPRGYTPTVNNDAEVFEKQLQDKKKKQKAYKVVIVGDPQVGKTTFLTKHLNDSFNASYHATIGASTFNLQFNTNLDSHKYEVYDVAGQNLFAGKRDVYYQDISGAVIMYDVMNWSSYQNVTEVWLKELREKAPAGLPIVVVGNKMENRDTRAVSVEVVAEAIQNTFEPDAIGYCEISVKTNQNLAEPFLFLTKRILGINDSNALYFVSKISELNLIESMLKHQKNKDESEAKAKHSPDVDAAAPSDNLDNLFLSSKDDVSDDKKQTKKGGDYLDDFIFSIGADDKKEKEPEKEKKKEVKIVETQSLDDNFLADMMGSNTAKSNKTASISKTPKITSINAKKQSSPQQRSRASSHAMATKIKKIVHQEHRAKIKTTQQQSKGIKAQAARVKAAKKLQTSKQSSIDNQGVLIDLLLGMQQQLNNVQSDMRRLQSDVTQIKQELQRNKSQRR